MKLPELDTDFPCWLLRELDPGLANIIIQGNDQYYSVFFEQWLQVPREWIGKVGADVVPAEVTLYGCLYRLSDAVHKCNFKAKYGIEKPESLVPRDNNPIYSRENL